MSLRTLLQSQTTWKEGSLTLVKISILFPSIIFYGKSPYLSWASMWGIVLQILSVSSPVYTSSSIVYAKMDGWTDKHTDTQSLNKQIIWAHPNHCVTCSNYISTIIILFCSLYLQQAMPSSLPKVLNAVKWNQHKDVAVVSIRTCACNRVPVDVR